MPEAVATPLETEDITAAGTVEEATDQSAGPTLVETDLLVEDVSIDGMCGVY